MWLVSSLFFKVHLKQSKFTLQGGIKKEERRSKLAEGRIKIKAEIKQGIEKSIELRFVSNKTDKLLARLIKKKENAESVMKDWKL